MKRYRVFVGIPVSKELKEEIERWTEENLNFPKIRAIPPDNLHMTLVPPWYEDDIRKIKEKLKGLRQTEPFEVEFEKIEIGPNRKNPRLVWATGKPNKNIKLLKKKAENLLDKRGEERPFLPHLTIARFKRKDFSKINFEKLEWDFYWKEKIGKVCLFESKLRPTGAEYEAFHKVRLAGK